MVGILFLIHLFFYPVPAHSQSEEWTPVYENQVIGQAFSYPFSNLDRIGLTIKKPVGEPSGELLVRLRKSQTGTREIVAVRLPLSTLVDGQIYWFRFRPLGDDEYPTYYVTVESTARTVEEAPAVRVSPAPVPYTVGKMEINGAEQQKTLFISLDTNRSLWTRVGYVLARFEIDKPWFYNRYFFIILFGLYACLVVVFLFYTYRLIRRITAVTSDAIGWKGFVLLLLALALVRGVLFSSLFPAWQAPDEPVHLATALSFREHHTLPPWDTTLDRRVLDSMDRADYALILRGGRPAPDWQTWIEDPRSESIGDRRAWLTSPGLSFLSHPILSLPLHLTDGLDLETQLYFARLFVVGLTFGLVALAWGIARRTWPDEPIYAVLVPSLFAFSTMMTYMSSVVSYDALTNISCATVIYIFVKGVTKEWQWQDTLWGGLSLGIALLIKGMVLLLIPGLICVCLLMVYRASQRRTLIKRLLVGVLIAGCVGGWWYVRNIYLYGAILPNSGGVPGGGSGERPAWTHGEMNSDLQLGTPEQFGLIPPAPILTTLVETPLTAVRGMLGNFGWGNAPLPDFLYGVGFLMIALAVLGASLQVKRGLASVPSLKTLSSTGPIWHAALAFCYSGLLMLALGRSVIGRYFFPVLIPLLCLFVYGILSLIPVRYQARVGWLLVLGIVLYDTIILVETIIPRYYLIPSPSHLLPFLN